MYVDAADKAAHQAVSLSPIAKSENAKKQETLKQKQEACQEKAVELKLQNNQHNEENKKRRIQLQQEEEARYEKQLENLMEMLPHTEPQYVVHEPTNRIMINLVDKNTQEVLKQIPPKKKLDLLAKSKEIAGAMMDKRL
ncbi:MAG: flagellar protein FlaG [Eubacterium sp.]|nr:flagellar protein FlaG [Eubacterium sp.]